MAGLWQQQFVSCCSLNFAVGRSELQKGLWQRQTGQSLLELQAWWGWGWGQARPARALLRLWPGWRSVGLLCMPAHSPED